MKNTYPKILLVTDGIFSSRHFGFNKTLYNIFSSYPVEKIFFLSPKGCKSYQQDVEEKYLKNTYYYKDKFFKHLLNRLGFVLNPFFDFINFSLAGSATYMRTKAIETINPDIIIVCPNTSYNLLAATSLLLPKTSRRKLYLFLMDDILDKNNKRMLIINFYTRIRTFFTALSGVFFISTYLAEQVFKDYKIPLINYSILHNPVNVDKIITGSQKEFNSRLFSIAYAGSIFEMHLDALILFSKALECINSVNLELIIYTQPHFFEQFSKYFTSNKVKYGGLLTDSELFTKLNKHDYLLCASSFSFSVKKLINTSVFTKITDYMVANRPIISIGPDYAANNRFIKDNDLGYIIDTENTKDITARLEQIINDQESYNCFVEKYPVFLKTEYDQIKVTERIIKFFNEK